jgi:TRAP-type C4-dicarboxylate transport system permease small subunit
VADILFTETTERHRGVGLVLERLCQLLAIASGIALLAMALLSLRSIVGRALFDSALVGDYELVQMLSAVAVALALPYANWIGAHVIVDFFTAKAPPRVNAAMDLVAQLLMALFSGLLAWRLGVGMWDLRGNHDASMMLNIPTWWSYAPMVPAFALLAATALYAAYGHLRKLLP